MGFPYGKPYGLLTGEDSHKTKRLTDSLSSLERGVRLIVLFLLGVTPVGADLIDVFRSKVALLGVGRTIVKCGLIVDRTAPLGCA